MALYLIPISMTIALIALWVRRRTWNSLWQRAATINIACHAVTFALLMPAIKPFFTWLHHVTGVWNLEDMTGHLAYVVGISALACTMLSRLQISTDSIKRPVAIMLPVLVTLFVLSAPPHHVHDLVSRPGTGWQTVYGLTLSATILWVHRHLLWSLVAIRAADQASKVVATMYIVAVICDICSTVSRCLTDFLPTIYPAAITLTLMTLGVTAYAAAAVEGMRRYHAYRTVPANSH